MPLATSQVLNYQRRVAAVIDKYGNTISVTTAGTKTRDDWGEVVRSGGVTRQTVAVTDNYVINDLRMTTAGKISDGNSLLLFKGDETINADDKITVDSATYNVINIQPLKAADVVVALEVEVGKDGN